jgi:hypothetical protein
MANLPLLIVKKRRALQLKKAETNGKAVIIGNARAMP